MLIIARYIDFIENYDWLLWIACFGIACCVGKYNMLKKWYVFIPVIAFDVIYSFIHRIIPISTHPETYVFVLVLLVDFR